MKINYKCILKKKVFFSVLIITMLYYKDKNLNIIKVGYFCDSLKNGGVERVMSILINHLSKEKKFAHYLITKKKILDGEYLVSKNIHRISLIEKGISLFEAINSSGIDILIYNFYSIKEIKELNKLKTIKVIYYDHSSVFLWIYQNRKKFTDTVYSEYKKCNYVISLIPLENDYLFKKWGITSILMDNPATFDYDLVVPSDLSKKNIIMIGRANDYIKRYDLGIYAMKTIIKEIPECQMNIVSFPEKKFEILIKNLTLQNNIRFVGYRKNIEIYLKNSSLHLLPSLSEAYPMVLSEAKIFGIPSIICGLDYLALAKKGTVIIYDDNPTTLAKESIKILNNDKYRKKLGKEARQDMKKRKNTLISKKWIKLILSVYRGKKLSFMKINNGHIIISKKEAEKILNNQLILLKRRMPIFKRLTIEKFLNFTLI